MVSGSVETEVHVMVLDTELSQMVLLVGEVMVIACATAARAATETMDLNEGILKFVWIIGVGGGY